MGRKKIRRDDLGEKKVYTFWLYPYEAQQMKLLFKKLKRERVFFEVRYRDDNETIE